MDVSNGAQLNRPSSSDQMTDAWRNHLNDLAKRSPIDPLHFFEFKPMDPQNQRSRSVR
jgi:hypothetical protein